MWNAKEGQIYICIKSDRPWWTKGKEYKVVLDNSNEPLIIDDDKDYWSPQDIIAFNNQFKLKEKQLTEGQTYVCKRDDLDEWTLGKEYKVVFLNCHGLVIVDDCGGKWYLPNYNLLNDVFKLKENTFDLNKLTTAQLREYIGLLEDKEESERLLNEFIERMTNNE